MWICQACDDDKIQSKCSNATGKNWRCERPGLDPMALIYCSPPNPGTTPTVVPTKTTIMSCVRPSGQTGRGEIFTRWGIVSIPAFEVGHAQRLDRRNWQRTGSSRIFAVYSSSHHEGIKQLYSIAKDSSRLSEIFRCRWLQPGRYDDMRGCHWYQVWFFGMSCDNKVSMFSMLFSEVFKQSAQLSTSRSLAFLE